MYRELMIIYVAGSQSTAPISVFLYHLFYNFFKHGSPHYIYNV